MYLCVSSTITIQKRNYRLDHPYSTCFLLTLYGIPSIFVWSGQAVLCGPVAYQIIDDLVTVCIFHYWKHLSLMIQILTLC